MSVVCDHEKFYNSKRKPQQFRRKSFSALSIRYLDDFQDLNFILQIHKIRPPLIKNASLLFFIHSFLIFFLIFEELYFLKLWLIFVGTLHDFVKWMKVKMYKRMTEAGHNRPILKLFGNQPSASATEVFCETMAMIVHILYIRACVRNLDLRVQSDL